MSRSTAPPEHFAKALLKFADACQPVRLEDIAKQIGLRIREVRSNGFEGALVRIANQPRGAVAVRESLPEVRKRFTIAHEIGHYILPGHDAANSVCREDQVGSLVIDPDSYEKAANKFAGELLMPSATVRRIVRKFGISIDTCKFVRDQFDVSLSAAAVKCVELTDHVRAALVVSERGFTKYFVKSPGFSGYIETGSELPSESLAKQLSARDPEKRGVVSAQVWIDIQLDVVITEDSILLPGYDRILTLLIP
jgi:Zn-dependent peptidase ImmA (M78 family)